MLPPLLWSFPSVSLYCYLLPCFFTFCSFPFSSLLFPFPLFKRSLCSFLLSPFTWAFTSSLPSLLPPFLWVFLTLLRFFEDLPSFSFSSSHCPAYSPCRIQWFPQAAVCRPGWGLQHLSLSFSATFLSALCTTEKSRGGERNISSSFGPKLFAFIIKSSVLRFLYKNQT